MVLRMRWLFCIGVCLFVGACGGGGGGGDSPEQSSRVSVAALSGPSIMTPTSLYIRTDVANYTINDDVWLVAGSGDNANLRTASYVDRQWSTPQNVFALPGVEPDEVRVLSAGAWKFVFWRRPLYWQAGAATGYLNGRILGPGYDSGELMLPILDFEDAIFIGLSSDGHVRFDGDDIVEGWVPDNPRLHVDMGGDGFMRADARTWSPDGSSWLVKRLYSSERGDHVGVRYFDATAGFGEVLYPFTDTDEWLAAPGELRLIELPNSRVMVVAHMISRFSNSRYCLLASEWDGVAWSPSRCLHVGNTNQFIFSYLKLASNASGDLLVVWGDRQSLWAATRSRHGQWSTDSVVTTVGYPGYISGHRLTLRVANNGRFYILSTVDAAGQNATADPKLFFSTSVHGGSWSPRTGINLNGQRTLAIDARVDDDSSELGVLAVMEKDGLFSVNFLITQKQATSWMSSVLQSGTYFRSTLNSGNGDLFLPDFQQLRYLGGGEWQAYWHSSNASSDAPTAHAATVRD